MHLKLEERMQAIELRGEGYSLNEITKKLKVAKSSVSIWTRNIQLTNIQRKLIKNKVIAGGTRGRLTLSKKWQQYRLTHQKSIPKSPRWPKQSVESFFETWAPDMAYILGYFAADGWLSKNKRGSCYLGFTSADKELILAVKKLMKVSNKIEVYQPKGNSKLRFTLQIGSKILYKKMETFGFTPKKSLTIKLPSIPSKLLGHFLRGYFDGDGCATFVFRRRKNRNNRLYPCYSIHLASGSYQFLYKLQKQLNNVLNITGGCLYAGKGCTRLTYTSNNVVKLFDFMYNQPGLPYLKRKYIILKKGYDYWGCRSIG